MNQASSLNEATEAISAVTIAYLDKLDPVLASFYVKLADLEYTRDHLHAAGYCATARTVYDGPRRAIQKHLRMRKKLIVGRIWPTTCPAVITVHNEIHNAFTLSSFHVRSEKNEPHLRERARRAIDIAATQMSGGAVISAMGELLEITLKGSPASIVLRFDDQYHVGILLNFLDWNLKKRAISLEAMIDLNHLDLDGLAALTKTFGQITSGIIALKKQTA